MAATLLSTHPCFGGPLSVRRDVTMNEQERAELEQIKHRQVELQMQVVSLGESIEQLSSRLNCSSDPTPESELLESVNSGIPPLAEPEILKRTVMVPPPIPPMPTDAG